MRSTRTSGCVAGRDFLLGGGWRAGSPTGQAGVTPHSRGDVAPRTVGTSEMGSVHIQGTGPGTFGGDGEGAGVGGGPIGPGCRCSL